MTAASPLTEFQWWYGRDEPPLEPVPLRAGPVTATLVGRDLRNVRYGGIEIAQRVYVAFRDRNWGTVPGEVSGLSIEQSDEGFSVQFTATHRQHDLDLVWRGEIIGDSAGVISYAMDAEAGCDITYKLVGLNVHHGMREYAGRPCRGETPDGPVTSEFSIDIAPQLVVAETELPIFPPVENLTIDLSDDVSVRFDFDGDTFEFEDQRNWTDASFKSQSYPPRRGGFFSLGAGERVWQKVTITPSGPPPPPEVADGPIRVTVGAAESRLPPIGLGMASHGQPLSRQEIALLARLRPDHLRVDIRLDDPEYGKDLDRATEAARALGCGLELALHLTDDAQAQLRTLAQQLAGTPVSRVLVFHQLELATDPTWLELARRELAHPLPGVPFAGGTNANFCELNRFRPFGLPADGIVYSINPQIHACDERSLVENIAGQAETVRTARAYGQGRQVVVSPVTLKQRFNAVATTDEPEPASGELPPQVDPRQMSLFAAAWTVGSLRALLESGADSITYYETTGWRGVIQGDQPPAAPKAFPARAEMVFPLYHVLADAAESKGGRFVQSQSSQPLAVETLALNDDGTLHLLVANLTPEPQDVVIEAFTGPNVAVRRLSAAEAEFAAAAPEAFREQVEHRSFAGPLLLALEPFETVRLSGLPRMERT